MKQNIFKLLWAVILFYLTGCAAVTVDTDYDRSTNFSQLRTFSFFQEKPTASQDEATGKYNAFLDDYLKSAIKRSLSAQGLNYNATNPDLKVAYDVSVDTETAVNTNYTYPPGFGYGYSYWYGYRYNYGFNRFPGAYRTVNQYKEGTVVVDLVDADTNELVWRGIGEAAVDMSGNISQETINTIVSSILEKYPPTAN